MKTQKSIFFITLLVIVLLLPSCTKNPVNTLFFLPLPQADDSAIPDSVKTVIYDDAASLVLRDALSRGSASLLLPVEQLDLVYSGLIHVYNARHLEDRDKVFKTHRIHAAPDPHPRRIMVKFDSSAVWADNWQHNIPESEDRGLTDLMQTYNITIPLYYCWGEYHVAYLETKTPLNTRVLAHQFLSIDGIHETQEVYEPSEKDITVTTGSYCWIFRFSLSPSQYWSFFVYPDGSVTSVGTG